MNSLPTSSVRGLPPDYLNPATWICPDESRIEPREHLYIYQRRKAAVSARLGGMSPAVVSRYYQMHPNELRRLVKRALTIRPDDGHVWGYRALIPYAHIREYHRMAPVKEPESYMREGCGLAGMFARLLQEHPELYDFVQQQRRKYPSAPFSLLHYRFFKKLRNLGITDDQYPFNTADVCKESLRKFCKALDALDFAIHCQNNVRRSTGHDGVASTASSNLPRIGEGQE